MNRIFTIEIDEQREFVEMHIDNEGARYLRDVLNNLITSNQNRDFHFMTPEWGGNELTSSRQNEVDGMKTINHLKLMYWKDKDQL